MNESNSLKLPTVIGDLNQFAIALDLDESYGGVWLIGKICFFIGGISVGDYILGSSLRDVLLQMHLILSDAGTRINPRFDAMDKELLFDTVWKAIYGDEKTGLGNLAVEECWAKHNITLPVDVFDYVRVFQFDEKDFSRLIWRSMKEDSDKGTNETRVAIGTTERVFVELSDVLTLLSRLTIGNVVSEE